MNRQDARALSWLLRSARFEADWLAATTGVALPQARVEEGDIAEIEAMAAATADPATPDGKVRPARIGRYVESLFVEWLEGSTRLQLLAANWPLREAGVTLGEADLLLQRRQAAPRAEHWEIAFKIYLALPDGRCHGPDPADTLLRKALHLERRQLRLTDRAAFRDAWPAQRHWTAGAIFAGRLFQPIEGAPGYAAPACASPASVPPQALTAGCALPPQYWIGTDRQALARAHDVAVALGVTHWRPLQRLEWIAPVAAPRADRGAIAGTDMRTLPAIASGSGATATMFAGFGPGGGDEALRLLLVDDAWKRAVASFATGSDDDRR